MTELLEIIDLDGDGFIGMNDFKSIVNSIDRRTAVINRDRLVKKVQSESCSSANNQIRKSKYHQ